MAHQVRKEVYRCLDFFSLQFTAVDNPGLNIGTDSTRAAAELFNLLNDLEGSLVSDLTEDDVLSIEPRGRDSGDEELGSVAVTKNHSQSRVNMI